MVLYVIGGHDYRACRLNSESVSRIAYQRLYDRTYAYWLDFSGRKHDFASSVSEDAPLRKDFLKALDSVAVMIKAQQSAEGGILAGYNYHLAYVRDQYGALRCLLRLGYAEEARNIMRFYWRVWQRSGKICNAQCPGVPGLFHEHENDEVEITGYLVLQAFDYLSVTGDNEFLIEILPMLRWAFDAQKKHLADGMLPFNGDETYVAGGILPRSTLNDGSAEATLLFLVAGKRLTDWLEANSQATKETVGANRSLLDGVERQYRHNFLRDGELITNNPERKTIATLPGFRHGVCEGCHQSPSRASNFYYFGWTEKNAFGRYLCPDCMVNNNIESTDDRVYHVHSIALVPAYIRSGLFSEKEISAMLSPAINMYQNTGKLPSRPDGSMTVGYDYGLLLYSLTESGYPLADVIFHKMMSVIDATGSWVEYYEDDRPIGTRCRPWESGINLEAAIHYMERNWPKH